MWTLFFCHTLCIVVHMPCELYFQRAGRPWPPECQRKHERELVAVFILPMHTEGGKECWCHFVSWPVVGRSPLMFGTHSFNGRTDTTDYDELIRLMDSCVERRGFHVDMCVKGRCESA
jgi:hypothetical protein